MIIKVFDYIFYRLYIFFKKTQNEASPLTASLTVSLLQFFLFLDIIALTRLVYEFTIPGKYYLVPILVGFGIFNWYRYEHNFQKSKYEDKWGDEKEQIKMRNGILIVLLIIVSIVIIGIYISTGE